jgi:alkanesulfonate monooxygenase SsuD/methylene tetrahydromethanopterin reductase-like flavin-dependent oxidoreductase (luciferase family)
VRRAVRYGIGWTASGIPPDQVAPLAARVRTAWHDAGRDGAPRIVAHTCFAVGDDVEERSYSYLRRPKAIQDAVDQYTDAGVDELILDPTVAELSQVERLANLVL